ncbi:MAG: hypothetical protein CSA66_04050 [Proteobacteria bacterium]|nr:MAG: hypothetical protein CSA66_04050 [Pseudomonadota bacterium]
MPTSTPPARVVARLALTLAALAATSAPALAADDLYGVYLLDSGVVLPYPLDNPFRGFADCRRGRHRHRAMDIGGVGPDYGLGTPIRAMFESRVTAIGRPEDDPKRWGRRLTDADTVVRGGRTLPAWKQVPGYGKVHFFTKDYGRSRTGVMIATRVTTGRHKGYKVTYMHLGAVHPELEVGDRLAPGQEIGVMGGTAVQESGPHVHVSVKNRRGDPVDVGPILGIGRTSARCRSGKKGERAQRARYSKRAVKLMHRLRRAKARTWEVPEPAGCGVWTYEGDFASGSFLRHRIRLPAGDRSQPWQVTLERLGGKWQPKLKVETAWGRLLYRGSTAKKADQRRYGLKRLANGRRGRQAKLRLKPRHGGEDLALVVTRWKNRKLPKDARYRLTVVRPCAGSGARR